MQCHNRDHENPPTGDRLQLCPHCGSLLGGSDITRRVRRKRTQLAQVGLVGGVLEKRRRKKGIE